MNRSNNNIMWDCMVYIFRGKDRWDMHDSAVEFLLSYHKNKGEELEFNFSHDNMMVVLCYLHTFDKQLKWSIPLLGKHSRHPMRFIMFAWMKYPILYPLRLITILDIIVKHGIIRRKTDGGQYHTSGLLLSYYRAFSYDQKVTMWILTGLMRTMFSDWDEVFERYHGRQTDYNYKVLLAFREVRK